MISLVGRAFFSMVLLHSLLFFFFFNDTATTEIYTLSLHDALPICRSDRGGGPAGVLCGAGRRGGGHAVDRSEEHTSELQSHSDLVCRLLLEKKKKKTELSTAIEKNVVTR